MLYFKGLQILLAFAALSVGIAAPIDDGRVVGVVSDGIFAENLSIAQKANALMRGGGVSTISAPCLTPGVKSCVRGPGGTATGVCVNGSWHVDFEKAGGIDPNVGDCAARSTSCFAFPFLDRKGAGNICVSKADMDRFFREHGGPFGDGSFATETSNI